VDATGTAWFVVRSKRQGGMSICLYRSAGRWYETDRFESAWIEDRPGVDVSSAPQRPASIAAADDGSIHLVWYGGSALAPAHQIRYARFAADPALRVVEESEPFPVSGFELAYPGIPSGDELWQEHPCIAAGPDGLDVPDPYYGGEHGFDGLRPEGLGNGHQRHRAGGQRIEHRRIHGPAVAARGERHG